jgi:hypothetical protein
MGRVIGSYFGPNTRAGWVMGPDLGPLCGFWRCLCVSLNPNNAPADVPTNRPMSLEELEGLFARAIQATAPSQNPALPIGGRLLTHYIHNNLQKNLLARPGQAIAVNPGKVTAARVDSRRDSYINALLI